MSVRFRKRIRVLGFFYLNISTQNISISVGTRGITYNFSTKKITFSVPNTGISYQSNILKQKNLPKKDNQTKNDKTDP
ncbi:TPA: DUF4236 domain-containing protein [Escherichia coli]